MAAYPESVTRLRLSSSWRLGPQTTALIQPAFYADLPFTSARPPRHIQLDGAALPELSVRPVTPLAGPGDPILAAAAADRVRELLSGGLVVDERRQPSGRSSRTRSPSSLRMSSRPAPWPPVWPICPAC